MSDGTKWLATARALEECTWLREVWCPNCAEENVTTKHSDESISCVKCHVEFDVPEGDC